MFIANFVPFLGLAVPGNGDGKRRFLFLNAALTLGNFLRRITPCRLGDFQPIICAFNHHAAAQFAEPLQIKAVGHVFRRRLAPFAHRQCFFNWHIEHAHFARRSHITGGAALLRSRRFRFHGNGLRIFKAQLAARQIRRTIACQVKRQRPLDPR
ncbi:MAG: hypothetical protein DME76_08595 [Verrucomicrobia bacterium]|nr:MAG: hypothetical protein DME76_08595 [Verrucomicrobiota bacterium]